MLLLMLYFSFVNVILFNPSNVNAPEKQNSQDVHELLVTHFVILLQNKPNHNQKQTGKLYVVR